MILQEQCAKLVHNGRHNGRFLSVIPVVYRKAESAQNDIGQGAEMGAADHRNVVSQDSGQAQGL